MVNRDLSVNKNYLLLLENIRWYFGYLTILLVLLEHPVCVTVFRDVCSRYVYFSTILLSFIYWLFNTDHDIVQFFIENSVLSIITGFLNSILIQI